MPPAATTTGQTISKCSGPASLNSVAFGGTSMIALISASATRAIMDVDFAALGQCSTNRRRRNFSRSMPAMAVFNDLAPDLRRSR